MVEVDIGMVKQGDILQIFSGEQIPLDGVVVEGKTYVDEAMMTGEPVPVKKQVHDTVIGGTVESTRQYSYSNHGGRGEYDFGENDSDGVAEAQRSKAPLQRLADVFAKYFVIVVLLISVLTFRCMDGVWWCAIWLGTDVCGGGLDYCLPMCAGFGDANVRDGH